jgi:hypothetical protein
MQSMKFKFVGVYSQVLITHSVKDQTYYSEIYKYTDAKERSPMNLPPPHFP